MAGAVALLVLGSPIACAAPSPERAAAPSAPPARRGPEPATSGPIAQAEPVAPEAPRFAVSSEHPQVTEVAMEVLAAGGTAADAAVAGVLTAGVVQPVSSGLGGDGFALVWDASARTLTSIDFRGAAPIGIRPSHYAASPAPGKQGVYIAVPGEPAGLALLHQRHGKLPFVELCRRAADLAERGFPIGPHMRRALGWSKGWLARTPRAEPWRSVLGALSDKSEVASPALAATLRKLGAEGRGGFYEGSVGADVVASARTAGSRMIADDLARYEAIAREPLVSTWEGLRVATAPPPSAGGVAIAQALAMHDKASLVALGYQSGAYLHLMAETARASYADRLRRIGDPAFVKMDVAGLVSGERMRARRASIDLDRTRRAEDFGPLDGGTSHIVVVDAQGSVVSITTSVGDMFGSRVFTESGFVLNASLEDFTDHRVARRFGATPSPNGPRGGARPVSSMAPVIVLEGDEPVLALGASGGSRIVTAVVQVLFGRLAFERPPGEVVADLRVDAPPAGGLLIDEGAPAPLVADLVGRGEVVTPQRSFSAVQLVARGGGELWAAADPRKDGAAAVGRASEETSRGAR